jgi:peptide/nickel transport system permease protein
MRQTIRKYLKKAYSLWLIISKKTSARIATFFILILLFVGLFADLIATKQPLFVIYKSHIWFPAFTEIWNEERKETIINPKNNAKETIQFDIADWKKMELDFVIWAPIPWSAEDPDIFNRDFVGPFEKQFSAGNNGKVIDCPFIFRHHLGTDQRGNDVLSGIIHGTSISLKIGLLSALIAGLIGIALGLVSGYYGDTEMYKTNASILFGVSGLIIGFFWGFITRHYVLLDAMELGFWNGFFQITWSLIICIGAAFVFAWFGRFFNKVRWLRNKNSFPLDLLIQRSSEVFEALPKLLIIITLAAVFENKSVGLVIAIIGLSNWTVVSRFARAEMLRTRELNYLDAAKIMGLSDLRILFKHALPSVLGPVMIEITFLIAGSIIIESSLSFLGIGVPDDVVTWGAMLSAGRQQFDAWWMVVFPGMAIFLTVLSIYVLGERLRNVLNSN